MTATAANIEAAAARILATYSSGVPCAPVRDLLADGDIDGAYAAQNINTDKWLAEGRRLVGRKIGLTSRVVQEQLGVDQPDFGMLYADMLIDDGAEVASGRLIQPRVEAEVAFVLGRDAADGDMTRAQLEAAIDHALPALEIVDSRIKDWNISLVDTIADNASSGLYVLGKEPRRLDQLDLVNCKMTMVGRTGAVSSGSGAACLGNPLNAALWLARILARVGRPLRAGDHIMSGALGAMAPAAAGDAFTANIEGLGSVGISFARG